ncbi:adhesin [Buttiauxella selenatireducens]|uniref:Adhesin n=1 Tax=Buttiauxella selenatireducens TaxID=3073902 RepID=A0ABY9S947_9ENTR|nr:adhesin [Buttiauxella sp. R73]WMY74028.1 adhesin [Buttiauxella sp. R73]
MHFKKIARHSKSEWNMFKNIAIILGLMMSGTIFCNAENLDGISIESLVINSFNVDEINGLQHFVCTLSLVDNKKEGFDNYVEGDICPAGKKCSYSAIMKLNGKITILEQVSSEKNISTFKNDDMTIISTQTPIKGSGDDEGGDVNAVITIKTKNGEKKVNMSGYCGI